MDTANNGFWTCVDLSSVRAVVPVETGDYHGVTDNQTGRVRAKMGSVPGFWRLKECKA